VCASRDDLDVLEKRNFFAPEEFMHITLIFCAINKVNKE
jgi:hypothetical protein